jgi:UDP-GlcNAc3NAcA epimerase
MLKIISLVGARPQFIKAASLSRIFNSQYSDKVDEIIVHSGQHYDDKMSAVFFSELEIPLPKYNLEVGSGSHATQTAETTIKLEKILLEEKPDCVVVFGDTNTTLAGTLAASKLNIPIAHIESGLRSFNKEMPEEINRIITDTLSTFLFCPTEEGVKNLSHLKSDKSQPTSGLNPFVENVGDIMLDSSLFYSKKASQEILSSIGLERDNYALATIHRDFNTDNKQRLTDIFVTLNALAERLPIAIPLHPRTVQKLKEHNITHLGNIKIIPPVSYLEMLALEAHSKFIITDSGGVQKEAFFLKKPSLILRNETEWIEIVENENALLCDADPEKIINGFNHWMSSPELSYPSFYGKGNTAELICNTLVNQLK